MNIQIERKPIGKIILNRPEVRNALNRETIQDLIHAFSTLGQDPEVRVIILSAQGEKAFCAGADLNEVATLKTVESVRHYFSLMATLIETIHQVSVPVIAATFGYTLAGGMGLAAAADFVIAAEDGYFGLPEVKIGLFPMVVMAPISRLIGPRRTLELALTGRLVKTEEMNQWGFCNAVVPFSEVQRRAMELAEMISLGSPLITRMGKEAWSQAQDLEYHKAVEYLKNMVSLVAMSEDSREGIKAFQEKRPPQWSSSPASR
ncbi:Enoyl-CoA hydratase/carnithine racemase [Sulfobacillus thermosulfidooxidans DSM 9293]|uniref:Enoyl-CoA hydratase/carnithine racemase n=1 Tax=Sulfobacillus thermosulfidooxidans (strain DSM 9293 / VKM B-1269 / AT-1) TaxID=929705 RepID=A0A1W1W6R4_SULTA|nr:enoyl-CoA hydratase/isomerase family protein [Sulfobacillus thermosulfidooxidans]SMC01809.1 Enoyl-CoA hydratase/carnithine racemase [Sulfobacillus thermosulfidooxidans DSM 9293]